MVLEEHDINLAGVTNEARIFERHGGRWKIAFWCVMDGSVGRRGAAVLHLATDGRVTWRSGAAIALLEDDDHLTIRNGKLRVRDSRTDKRLQEAIRWAAGLDTMLYAAHGAVPIVFEAGEGVPARVWWIIAESGLIVFSMGEEGLTEQRIETVANVLSLSPAQHQVASHIVAGRSLTEIARVMKISPNTARTHLDRIFVKTGVNSQQALVRTLLSTVSPV